MKKKEYIKPEMLLTRVAEEIICTSVDKSDDGTNKQAIRRRDDFDFEWE